MEKAACDFGMIGLGVMGRNFLLNVADHQFAVIGHDLDVDKVTSLSSEANNNNVRATTDLKDFVNSLEIPRRIMLLVPAGQIVDAVIESLIPLLDEGDIIIDGGNSHYNDTTRRMDKLALKKLHFLGMGVSGGEEGARCGPSLMPGGSDEAYKPMRDMLEAAAAKVNGQPCVALMGDSAAGHYVKMVHNGIEYGIMQLLAEMYDVLHQVGGLDENELHQTFSDWNSGELQSYLVEITADIFAQPDELKDGEMLINSILDSAKQKGTGKWTSQSAMDLGIAIPTIDAAVTMRYLSALKKERTVAHKLYDRPLIEQYEDKAGLVLIAKEAFHFAMVISYAQGFAMLQQASEEMGFGLRLSEVAKVWRGGCIIRAKMLDHIMQIFRDNPKLKNLLLESVISGLLNTKIKYARELVVLCVKNGLPAACLSASLSYFDGYRSARLPSNLIQAQRDYFGAHTYERVDQKGSFHTDWGEK